MMRVLTQSWERRLPEDTAGDLESRGLRTRLKMMRRIGTVIVGLIAAGVALLQFEVVRSVGVSLLASAGIAGILVGIAAQRTLGGIIAGIEVSITQPVRIGDIVVFKPGEIGTVEQIYFTYVIVRLWDDRRMIVPVTRLMADAFENWTRTDAKLLAPVEIFVDYAIPFDKLRDAFRELCEANDKWDGRVCRVELIETTDKALKVRGIASVDVAPKAWDLRSELREGWVRFVQGLEDGRYLPVGRVESRTAAFGARRAAHAWLTGRLGAAAGTGARRGALRDPLGVGAAASALQALSGPAAPDRALDGDAVHQPLEPRLHVPVERIGERREVELTRSVVVVGLAGEAAFVGDHGKRLGGSAVPQGAMAGPAEHVPTYGSARAHLPYRNLAPVSWVGWDRETERPRASGRARKKNVAATPAVRDRAGARPCRSPHAIEYRALISQRGFQPSAPRRVYRYASSPKGPKYPALRSATAERVASSNRALRSARASSSSVASREPRQTPARSTWALTTSPSTISSRSTWP
jgi:hypothetical protein